MRPEVGWDKNTTTCCNTNSIAMKQATPTQSFALNTCYHQEVGPPTVWGRTGWLGRLSAGEGKQYTVGGGGMEGREGTGVGGRGGEGWGEWRGQGWKREGRGRRECEGEGEERRERYRGLSSNMSTEIAL